MSPAPGTMGRIRLIVLLLILPLVLCLLPARVTSPLRVVFLEAIGPLQGAAFEGAGDVAATGGTLSEMFLAEERKRALGTAVSKLRNDLVSARQEVKALKERLKSVQNLEAKGLSYEKLSARVTAYDSVSMQRSVTVAAGRTDGLREGQAVCALGALVGRVQEVGPWHSRVRLITDPGSRIACRLSSTRAICVALGTGGRSLEIDWLDRHSEVKPGDTLVTASLTQIGEGPAMMPPNLPVANVTEVQRSAQDPLLLSVHASPRVPTERLEWVEIMIPSGGKND